MLLNSSLPGDCRLCRKPLFEKPLITQIGMPSSAQCLPQSKELDADKGVTLAVYQCSGCGLIQLTTPPVFYWRDVIRAAGISPEMYDFRLTQFSQWLQLERLIGRKVLEVGCGRGEYLTLLKAAGAQAYGVENCVDSVRDCVAAGLTVQQTFIENSNAKIDFGPFDGFVMLNFLEHIPHADQTLQGIAANLIDGACGLVEVPNFDMILQARMFAEFIPDHLYYFTQKSLTTLLESNGFEVEECVPTWHNYILSARVRKRKPMDLASLQMQQYALREDFQYFIGRFGYKKVAIWGAGHQALALISLLSLADSVLFVLDSAPFKQNRFTPATHLPIVSPERLTLGEVDAVIVLAASYSTEVARIIFQKHGDRFKVAVLKDDRLIILTQAQV